MSNNDELVNVAMGIILKAGDAKNLCTDALDCAKKGNIETAMQHMVAANEAIVEAHALQTTIIQDEARGIKHETNILFHHAQDTLMVTMAEIRLTQEFIEIYELIKE